MQNMDIVKVSDELLKLTGENKETFLNRMKEGVKNTMIDFLDMEFVEFSTDRLVLKMPVGPKTRQPMGILHGGASVALAETAASLATVVNTDIQKFSPVGMEINANHLRSKKDGFITATATPFHKGRTTMVWDIKITDEDEALICISRCTMAVVAQK